MQWIIQGNTEHDIKDAIAQKFPGEKAEPLITTIVKRLEDSGQTSPDLVKGFCIEATRELMRKMIEVGDYANALAAVKTMHAISRK